MGAVSRLTPVRPVLDTSVLISSLLFSAGQVSWLREAWRQGRIRPLISRETTAELIQVLAYPKFSLDADDQRELLDDYLPYCEGVDVSGKPAEMPQYRDPFDQPFLHLAAAGQADVLVTGDADILALADAFAVPILSPGSFRRRLSGEKATDS